MKDQPRISINLDVVARNWSAPRGLTLKEAENVFAKTPVLDGSLTPTTQRCLREKQQIIRKRDA